MPVFTTETLGPNAKYVGVSFNTIAKRGNIQAIIAVKNAARWVLKRSRELVPLDKNPLQKSGTDDSGKVGQASPFQRGEKEVRAEVTYGNDTNVHYAVLQHENTMFRHKKGRSSHYLSRALAEAHAQDILLISVKERMKKIMDLTGE